MKFCFLILFLLLCALPGRAQTLLIAEGFEDGNFTDNPQWNGDTDEFQVIETEPNHLLQLQGNSAGGISYLSTPSTGTTGSWEFYYRYDASSAPSASNKATIFLMSDRDDLEGAVNGYAVQVGRTGDDVFELVRYDNGEPSTPLLSDTTLINHNATGYRIRILRTAAGQWRISVGKGYSGALLDAGGTVTDNTYNASAYFGVQVQYTSTRAEQFFFDFNIDLPPFRVTNVISLNDTNLELSFNRNIDLSSISESSFSFSPQPGAPLEVNPVSSTILRLQFATPLPSNRYTLVINGVRDDLNNSLDDNTHEFIVFGAYAGGEVLINEFLYDPPSGTAEYVELYNLGNSYLNLTEWRIEDRGNAGVITAARPVLEPGGYLVLSTDTLSLQTTFGPGPYISVNLPALNNSGDLLLLRSPTGSIADSLSYSPSWGGSSVALERRSSTTASFFKENWAPSPAGTGTPGQANEVLADQTPPELLEILVDSIGSSLTLLFSERITGPSSLESPQLQITPQVAIESITIREDSMVVALPSPLAVGISYSLGITNLRDIFGNFAPPLTRQLKYVKHATARPGMVVINEINYRTSPANTEEFIELFNAGPDVLDLSNWSISDGTAVAYVPEGITLMAGEFMVLTGSPSFAGTHGPGTAIANFPVLNDRGDYLYLKDTSHATIDSLSYLASWGSGFDDASLERKDPEAASNDPNNWQASIATSGHTAGIQNSVFHPDDRPPELIFANLLPSGYINVQFNEFIQLTTQTKFTINDLSLPVVSLEPNEANRVQLQLPNATNKATARTLRVANIDDIKGNHLPSADIELTHMLRPSDVVINEIMFRPLQNSEDNRPDQSEYIELRNRRDYALSLEGLVLHDSPDEEGEIREIVPISSGKKWIPPGGIVLIYADQEHSFPESLIARFFKLEPPDDHLLLQVDRASLSLGSSDDAVYIADSTGTTIDSVYYQERWHNPNIADTRGIALERIAPEGPSNDPTNWGSNISVAGGSPGQENSIYQAAPDPSEQPGLQFSPNPFSPDDDGYEDHLFIHYRLDAPDYLIRAEIYDRYGRFITTLADGQPAGFEGTLIWDGRRSNGGRNKIGIYIVLFDAYNSSSGARKTFKKTLVLARRF